MPPDRDDDTISVTGEAFVDAIPDETRFRITLSAVRPGAEEALEDVTIRSKRLDAILTELGVAHEKRSTAGLSLQEKRRWIDEPTAEGSHRERSVREGYEANNTILVRLEDPSLTGRLIQRSVEEVDASIDGPYWHIGDENQARIEASGQAVRDAERKAQAYADALGVRLGAVRSLLDLSGWDRPRARALSYGPTMAEGIGIEANIQVTASVTVRYAIEDR